MRIKKEDIIFIKKITKEYFGNNAKVYLFGSRVDDQKKGGDIDLYIETDMKNDIFKHKSKISFEEKINILLELQKLDIEMAKENKKRKTNSKLRKVWKIDL